MDDYDDDDDDDAVEFISPFEVDLNLYEFIPSLANEDKSLELFYSFSFEGKNPSTGFEEAAEKVVKYVQGHPLALKVLGRFLYGKTVRQWDSELDQLKLHPNEKIQRVLRLSYDDLNLQQQNILLDIACLFIGEKSDFVASILDGCNFFADTNMQVLVDKSLIAISSNMSLQMHDLVQAMTRAIVREESIVLGKKKRLLISSNVYDISGQNKVATIEAVEVLVVSLEKFSQKVHIDANDFAHMKKLRILKIYQREKLIYSGNLYYLSNELSLFYWHGCPFKYLPSDFYPENIVAIDLSYSNIKQFWTTPKCFKRLKVMKLGYCCNLTTTPDFSEITNLEELSFEGCVNLVSVHPSIGMLKRLVVLNLRDCKQLRIFPSRVEMDSLQVLNLSGCLKVNQLPEDLGRIKSLTELHVDRTAITEVPSFVSALINLESLSFGGQGRIQPRWWTSITAPLGLLSKQQHPQKSVFSSLEGLHMLKKLNFSYCNLEQVPESIGGLSFLNSLNLWIGRRNQNQELGVCCSGGMVYEKRTKTALGAQNPFHLRQAKKAQPALYDGEELLKTHHVRYNVHLFSRMHVLHMCSETFIVDLESENFNLRNKIQNDDHDSMIKHFSKLEVEHFNLQLKYQNLKEHSKSTAIRLLIKRENLLRLNKENSDANPTLDLKALVSQNKELTAKLNAFTISMKALGQKMQKISCTKMAVCVLKKLSKFGECHGKCLPLSAIVAFPTPTGWTIQPLGDQCPLTRNTPPKVLPTKQWKPTGSALLPVLNRTLVEATRTMLIFSKATLFLWAEAVATACYTQNRSLIHTLHNKTPYELVHDKKPDLSFLRIFGALCYLTNDSEDLGKLKTKADIGFFVGYAPNKNGYRIYNKRTRQIMETIHFTFDELTEQTAPVHSRLALQRHMASADNSSGPAAQRKERCTLQCALSSEEENSSCV
ncbi:NB-ARC domains-containing protein [Tanacetum coccineum]